MSDLSAPVWAARSDTTISSCFDPSGNFLAWPDCGSASRWRGLRLRRGWLPLLGHGRCRVPPSRSARWRWRTTSGPRRCVNALKEKRDDWMLRWQEPGSRSSEGHRCFGWCAYQRPTIFSIIWAMPAFWCAAFRSMPHGCESACLVANPRGPGFAQRLRSFQVRLSVKPLPRKAISTMPEIADWTPFAFIVDSLLVGATDYAVGHHD